MENGKGVPRLCPSLMAVAQHRQERKVHTNPDQGDTGIPILPHAKSLSTPLCEG